MPTLALHAFRRILPIATELRIDVNHALREVETELDAIHDRMNRSLDRLYGLPEVQTDIPSMVLRYREADGEYYVYVVDARPVGGLHGVQPADRGGAARASRPAPIACGWGWPATTNWATSTRGASV